jgi:hypothetical protein
MFIRTVRVPSSNGTINKYVRIVEAYRQDGKVKQRVIADLGRKDLLTSLLPQLQRVLLGEPSLPDEDASALEVVDASTWGPVLVVRALFQQLGLRELFDELFGASKTGVSCSDRAFVRQGKLKDPAKIGAAAPRAMQAHKGSRYFDWELRDGVFEFVEHPVHFEREKRLEGR